MTEEVIAIVGPTASGKSHAALTLASAWDGEIVSCDSMQIYRGMDIGTAKPTADDRARVLHHLLDVADPHEGFSAARYAELADRAIEQIQARARVAIVVGGTGLYLRALRFGLFDAPPRDEALRAELYEEDRRRPGALHLKLREVDPESAARIAPADLVRVVRALEVHALTGKPISAHHAAHVKVPKRAMHVCVIDPPPDILAESIADRAKDMLAEGLVDETRALRGRFGSGATPLSSVGYREVCQFLDGAIPEAELPGAIERATRKYARRQRTWFKKEPLASRYGSAEALIAALTARGLPRRGDPAKR